MSDGLYVGMSGAVARSEQLDAIADGLANAQTPGFKSSRPGFATVLAQTPSGDRAYVAAVSTQVDKRAGALQQTGNALDITPEGERFLSVRTPSGKTAYTRDGRLSVDSDGALRVAGGVVLGESGNPINIPPGAPPTIGKDGAVSAGGVQLDKLALFELEGPLQHAGGSLYSSDQVKPVEKGSVHVGAIELGNTTALDAAVGMVSAQRSFESSMQVIETYKKMGERSNEIGRVR